MGFLAPWFLAGLAAIGLPLWVHLLRRHKSEPLPFSSLMFFEKRTQSSIKHRRLQHLLLLAARLAMIILLALAFASPYIMKKVTAGGGEAALRIIAIDDSFSMRAGNRMERAKAEARALLNNWRPAQQGQVIALSRQVRLLTQPTNSAEELRAAIDSLTPGDGRSSYGEFARALRATAESLKKPIEVHLISDMQKSSRPPSFADLRLDANTTLTIHDVGSATPNWTVESVNAPRRFSDPKRVRIFATAAAFAAPAATKQITVACNGKTVATKSVNIPANGRASAEFLGVEAPHGLNRCEARIDGADALPQDDAHLFSLERSDPRRILFVHEGRSQRDLLYYRSAIESSSESNFAIEPVAADAASNAGLDKFAFVVLSDVAQLSASLEENLRKYVRNGGSLLIALGPSAAARSTVPVLGLKINSSAYASRAGERFQLLGAGDDTHAALRNTNRWENVKFYQTIRVDAPEARIVARLADQSPVLLEQRSGEGRVLVFTSTFDNIANDFPLHPSFIPFVEQTARYLSGYEDTTAGYTVASTFELRREGAQAEAVEVLGPDGARALTLQEAARAKTLTLDNPGYYEVRRGSGRNELVAVNIDRRESDLEPLPKESVELWQGRRPDADVQSAAAGRPFEEQKPENLWWWFVLALAVVALAESVLASRYLGMRT
ncbi:MAG: BatA domain-containing protein [Bryobacteraceae bacterium]|nr:BatA domain-containing protein [Bryobacteraceae bacterium]